jgi:hypothetical protein
MTPTEKATQILNDMLFACRENEPVDGGYFTNKIKAKRCALVTVDEILKELKEVCKRYPITSSPFNYYEAVKNEIEKYDTN